MPQSRKTIRDGFRRTLDERARLMRANATRSEAILWSALRKRRLHGVRFRRQYVIGEYIVDFVAPAFRLVVEVDGSVHDDPDQRALDAGRQRALEAVGFRVVRVRAELVEASVEAALRVIRAGLWPGVAQRAQERSSGERALAPEDRLLARPTRRRRPECGVP